MESATQTATNNESNQPKRAIVLPGGGGRGAYQVGVVKALMEQGLTFDFAFGTSIGGLNAAMIAQGDLQRLEELWSTMKAKDIFFIAFGSPNWPLGPWSSLRHTGYFSARRTAKKRSVLA